MIWNNGLWNDVERMRREMDNLYRSIDGSLTNRTYPLVNVYENADEVLITAELAGVKKEDVDLTFSEGVLTIKGKREKFRRDEKVSIIRQERSSGDFEKSIRIPTKVQNEKVRASFKDGVLTIGLPKAEEAKPKTITIHAE